MMEEQKLAQEQYITSRIIQGLQHEIGILNTRVYELIAKEELYVLKNTEQAKRIKELEDGLAPNTDMDRSVEEKPKLVKSHLGEGKIPAKKSKRVN